MSFLVSFLIRVVHSATAAPCSLECSSCLPKICFHVLSEVYCRFRPNCAERKVFFLHYLGYVREDYLGNCCSGPVFQ